MSDSLRLAVLAVLFVIVAGMWGLAFVSKRFERVASGVAALDPRSFESFSVIAVGSGGSFENPWRLGPCVAVGLGDDLVLVDAGRGVAEALRAAEIPAHQPTVVLLTSLLPENTVGLDDLWLTGWLGPRAEPLQVYGPPGTGALVAGLARSHERGRDVQGREWELPAAGAGLEARELEHGAEIRVGALTVRAGALEGGSFPAFAYRIAGPSRAALLASAGFDPDGLVELASETDLLVVGAVSGASLEAAAEAGVDRLDVLQREARSHLRLEEVGALARRAGVRTLVLTRLRPPPVFDFQYERVVGAGFPGRVVVASDGDVVTP